MLSLGIIYGYFCSIMAELSGFDRFQMACPYKALKYLVYLPLHRKFANSWVMVLDLLISLRNKVLICSRKYEILLWCHPNATLSLQFYLW